MSPTLPLDGWRRRAMFLEEHPNLRALVPNTTSLDWVLRLHRRDLSPYLRRHGRVLLIHDRAADVLPGLLLRPVN